VARARRRRHGRVVTRDVRGAPADWCASSPWRGVHGEGRSQAGASSAGRKPTSARGDLLLGVVDRLAVHGGTAGPASSLGSKLTSERQRSYSRTSADDGFGTHGGADDVSRVPRRAVATGIPTRGGGGRHLIHRAVG